MGSEAKGNSSSRFIEFAPGEAGRTKKTTQRREKGRLKVSVKKAMHHAIGDAMKKERVFKR